MSERAPASQIAAQEEQLRVSEIMAYAMKPEMDKIAEDRAAAPRAPASTTAGEDGVMHLVDNAPDLSPVQQKVHAAREFYANRAADHAVELDAIVRDRRQDAAERIAARNQLHALLDPSVQARPEEQIRKIVDK